MPGGDKCHEEKLGRRHRYVMAMTLDRVSTEGLVEEAALARKFQPKGQASAKAPRQPMLSTLAISMEGGAVSYCPLRLSTASNSAHNSRSGDAC